jgi:hypothetical protein
VVVGQTTLQPNESTTMTVPFRMGQGMAGPHKFEITITSNDPEAPHKTVTVTAVAGP